VEILSPDVLNFIARLLVATVLGGIVGLQRERGRRPAGLRTHTLVCVGAALITIVSESYIEGDRARIAAQIVSGIGFLGAGTIIREGPTVRGLTTAASLWAVAGVGIACGRGGTMLLLGAFTTFLVWGVLSGGSYLEALLVRRQGRLITVRVVADADALPNVLEWLVESRISILGTARSSSGGVASTLLRLQLPKDMQTGTVLGGISKIEGVQEAKWDTAEPKNAR
jgi:putative Mg2+ transporter-C (MgtC) family protein